jgi:hypothetical protein
MIARIFNNEKNCYEICATRFRITTRSGNRYFPTQKLADEFVGKYFQKHGTILSIEQVPAKPRFPIKRTTTANKKIVA